MTTYYSPVTTTVTCASDELIECAFRTLPHKIARNFSHTFGVLVMVNHRAGEYVNYDNYDKRYIAKSIRKGCDKLLMS